MHTGLYNLIYRLATWPVVALLFIAYIFCNQGFAWRQTKLGPQIHLLDERFLYIYSPTEAQELFVMLGEEGRQIYARTELTLDLIFPLIYGSLIAIFLIRLYSGDTGKKLIIFPLLTVVADYLENGTVAYLAMSFDGKASILAWASSIFTLIKWVTLLVCLLIVLKGGLVGIWRSKKAYSNNQS